MSKVVIACKALPSSTYEDIVKGQVSQGFTQLTWITSQIFEAEDLPEGSLPRILESPGPIRP